ncbi:MAG: YncE family protein, partial [Actinomycetia bacterium]|nr:YncE family protein [Actinomycetes bacterium]
MKHSNLFRPAFVSLLALLLLVGLLPPAEAQPYAYIPNSGDNTVSVIDTAADIVVDTIPVGSCPQGVAVHPSGDTVYVTNGCDSSVSLIDTATATVIATVPVGTEPHGIAIPLTGASVYVGNIGGGSVSVIDADTDTVVDTILTGGTPHGLAVHPAGTSVYAPLGEPGSNILAVIDTATREVVDVEVGDGPLSVVVDPSGSLAYAGSGRNGGVVSVVDTATNAVVDSFQVSSWSLHQVAVDSTGSTLYATDHFSDKLWVVDLATKSIIASVAMAPRPVGVAVHPSGEKVYVTNDFSNIVSVVDTATNLVTHTIPVGASPIGIGQFIATSSTGPELSIASGIPAAEDEPVDADVVFAASGSAVAATTFSLDYDEDCLFFDPIDFDPVDGIPDNLAIHVPGDFTVTAFHDVGDSDGEIDISIVDLSPPFATLPDGQLVTATFTATCSPEVPGHIDADVGFSADPAASFSDDAAQDLDGTTVDGSVRIYPGPRGDCNFNGAVTAADLVA